MGMGGCFFFVMIRMALGTRPNSARWIQNRTEGKYFSCSWGVFLICYSFRTEVKNAPVNVLRAWCHLGIILYISCMFSSSNTFRIRIVVLFIYFRKEIVYSVFVQLSVGESFDNVWRSR